MMTMWQGEEEATAMPVISSEPVSAYDVKILHRTRLHAGGRHAAPDGSPVLQHSAASEQSVQ